MPSKGSPLLPWLHTTVSTQGYAAIRRGNCIAAAASNMAIDRHLAVYYAILCREMGVVGPDGTRCLPPRPLSECGRRPPPGSPSRHTTASQGGVGANDNIPRHRRGDRHDRAASNRRQPEVAGRRGPHRPLQRAGRASRAEAVHRLLRTSGPRSAFTGRATRQGEDLWA
jgi:hypothetical protein